MLKANVKFENFTQYGIKFLTTWISSPHLFVWNSIKLKFEAQKDIFVLNFTFFKLFCLEFCHWNKIWNTKELFNWTLARIEWEAFLRELGLLFRLDRKDWRILYNIKFHNIKKPIGTKYKCKYKYKVYRLQDLLYKVLQY